MGNIIQQAVEVAQDLDVRVFPVDKDKRPTVKGWREKATSDPEKIRRLFTGAAGIGVPCGPDNDIICFDVDFGHTQDEDRLAKLHAWVEKYQEDIEEAAMVRRSRSGGLHIIYAWPSSCRPPRRVMPKIDVIIDGFYFVWAMEDGSYQWMQGGISDEPPEDMCQVVEKSALSSGSALMSAEEAHEAMWSDGDAGARHDALLRMTQDWAGELPGKGVQEWCSSFETWFRDIYGDRIEAPRLDKLLEWDVENERGELYRAFKGVSTTEAHATELLAAAGAKLKSEGRLPATARPEHEERSSPPPAPIEGDLFTVYSPGDGQQEPAPWLIPNLLRERGNAGFIGMSGVGKTTITASWVAGMTSGRTDVVGLPPVNGPLPVAWLNAEEEASDMAQHVEVAEKVHGLRPSAPLLIVGEERLDNSEDGLSLVVMKRVDGTRDAVINEPLVDKIVEEVKAAGIKVMIADPITEFNDGNENDRGHAKILNRAFKMIAQRAGVAVIYWAHTAQPQASSRPDWYKSDLYAQRGSSQNVGALKTMGTVWHMTPAGVSAPQAWDWVKNAKRGDHEDTPNLVALTVIKIKKSPTLFEVAYEIRPSSVNADVPVVLWHTLEEARLMVDQQASDSGAMIAATLTKHIVSRLGEGEHERGAVNRHMEGVDGWPKDVRANRENGKRLLSIWERGVPISVEGASYMVQSKLSEGQSFTLRVWRC